MKKNLIKSEKSIFFLLGIIAIFVSSIIALSLSKNINKYDFAKVKEFFEGKEFNTTSHYYDLNNDGLSERIPVAYWKEDKNSWLQIHNINGDVVDQFNFWLRKIFHDQHTHNSWMTVEDWDDDGIKEIFITSMEKDSLFLNIISTRDSKFILKNRLIYIRKSIRKKHPWDVFRVIGKTLDVNKDGSKDLLLSFGTGYSLQPRGFMTYDIINDSIIDTFFTKASFTDISILDIDNDGEVEILCRSGAGGNYSDTTGYPDNKAWFFVLNKDLSFKLPPRSYGQMQTSIQYTVVDSEIIIIATGINDSLDAVYERISNKGKLLARKTFEKLGNGKIQSFYQNGELFFISTMKNRPAIIYDQNLNVIIKKDNFGYYYFAADFTADGKKELVFKYKNRFIITNQLLDKIAEFSKDKITTTPELVLLGKNKANGIAIQTANVNTIYQLEFSLINKLFIPLTFLFGVLLFFVLLGFHYGLKQVSMVYQTFSFFINENDSALMLINPKGKLLNYNKQLLSLMRDKNIKKGINYNSFLANYNDIKSNLDSALLEEKAITDNISIFINDESFKGKIEIIPFKSFFGYTFAYLVKIVDQTTEIMNERMQVWSHTAQKIAHEIKTPLGSIQLNLKALKKRIQLDYNNISYEIKDDISTIESQVKRIKKLTSSFLKISNLEKSEISVYSLSELINNALQKFNSYLTDRVEIKRDKSINGYNVSVDKNQFIELLQIIFENSIDALGGKGEIKLSIKNQHSVLNENNMIKLVVKDFGKGIKPEHLEKVFDPYFTTKEDGTGLGLAFARKIIRDNHGTIEIESNINEGTSVILTIPLAE
ncbi:MAG: HAMP domain-containing histidine kinase [Flavobacteriaceae bacterium]|nr:HAMP domain-containing histidine kinase [Flavobacteriaceae bacterium]